jgi:hypothetical protein
MVKAQIFKNKRKKQWIFKNDKLSEKKGVT